MANITENYKAVLDGLSENFTKLGFTKCNDTAENETGVVTRFQSEKGVVAIVLKDNIISLMGGEDLENVESTLKDTTGGKVKIKNSGEEYCAS